MKKIIDYLFYRYYLISIKKEESPRFGATCVLAEVVTMVYLFAVLILSFLLTGDFFLPYTSGRTRIIIGIIGCFLPSAFGARTRPPASNDLRATAAKNPSPQVRWG